MITAFAELATLKFQHALERLCFAIKLCNFRKVCYGLVKGHISELIHNWGVLYQNGLIVEGDY